MLWFAAGCTLAGQPPATEALLAAVSLSPPEIGADLILSVLERPHAVPPNIRDNLLATAESLIARAKYPARIQAAVPAGRSTDSSIGMLTMALDRRADKRSLTSRFVTLVVQDKPNRARRIVEDLAISPLPSLSCDQGYVWASPDEFEALRIVWEQGFSARERAEGKHREFLVGFINRLEHPAQLEPLLSVLAQLALPEDALQEVITALGALLERAPVDARTSQVVLSPALSQRLLELWRRAKSERVAGEPILVGFTKYLHRVGTYVRCEDSDAPLRAKIFLTSMKTLWSEAYPAQDSAHALPEIGDLVSKDAKGKATGEVYWQQGKDKGLAQSLIGTWRMLKSATPPSAIETEAAVEALLHRVEEWRQQQSSSEEARDRFNKLCLVYRELIEGLPAGAVRAKVAEDYISLLSISEMLNVEPVLWNLHARMLVDTLKRPELQDVGIILRKAGHPILLVHLNLCGADCGQNDSAAKGGLK